MHVGSVKFNSSIKCVANIIETFLTTMKYNSNKCQDNLANVVDTCLSCEDIARQRCRMVPRW